MNASWHLSVHFRLERARPQHACNAGYECISYDTFVLISTVYEVSLIGMNESAKVPMQKSPYFKPN